MLPSELWTKMKDADYHSNNEIVPLCDTLTAEINKRLGGAIWGRCPICMSMKWNYHIILGKYYEYAGPQSEIFASTAAILAELDKEVVNAAQ